jgi:hypothetical protein
MALTCKTGMNKFRHKYNSNQIIDIISFEWFIYFFVVSDTSKEPQHWKYDKYKDKKDYARNWGHFADIDVKTIGEQLAFHSWFTLLNRV